MGYFYQITTVFLLQNILLFTYLCIIFNIVNYYIVSYYNILFLFLLNVLYYSVG